MKRIASIAAALALGLLLPGCVFTSGQIRIDFDLPNFTASTQAGITGQPIDLNDEEEYADNKDKLKDLADLAVLGGSRTAGRPTSTSWSG